MLLLNLLTSFATPSNRCSTPTEQITTKVPSIPVSQLIIGQNIVEGAQTHLVSQGFHNFSIMQKKQELGAQHSGQIFIQCHHNATTDLFKFFLKIFSPTHEKYPFMIRSMCLTDHQHPSPHLHKSSDTLSEKYPTSKHEMARNHLCIMHERIHVTTNQGTTYAEIYPQLPEGEMLCFVIARNLSSTDPILRTKLKKCMTQSGNITGYLIGTGYGHADCSPNNFWVPTEDHVVAFDFSPHYEQEHSPKNFDPIERFSDEFQKIVNWVAAQGYPITVNDAQEYLDCFKIAYLITIGKVKDEDLIQRTQKFDAKSPPVSPIKEKIPCSPNSSFSSLTNVSRSPFSSLSVNCSPSNSSVPPTPMKPKKRNRRGSD